MDNDFDHALIALLHDIGDPARPVAGREDAFRRLYDMSSLRMYGVALRVVGNREWAEDVLQEAYRRVSA